MPSKKEEIKKDIALRLKELRKFLNYSHIEISSKLGITKGAYTKNEQALNLPGIETQQQLAVGLGVSMDWLLFGKGPIFYNTKEKAEKLDEKLRESEKKNEELTAELEKMRYLNRELETEKRPVLADLKPDVSEMLEHMARIPLLHHEILARYQRFRVENKDLLETAVASPDQK
jgi:transcriptional regulator with XRE-family HTH domain